jgi:hypothetical protein
VAVTDDPEDEVLSERQVRLLDGLREAERHGRPAEPRTLARTTGYTESSIRTYFTKRLEGVLVFRDEQGEWRVRGAVRMSEEEFARKMSQKAGAANDALRTEDAWRAVVRKLLYEGQRRHYHLSREELDLVAELSPAEPARPPTAELELPLQPPLFKR